MVMLCMIILEKKKHSMENIRDCRNLLLQNLNLDKLLMFHFKGFLLVFILVYLLKFKVILPTIFNALAVFNIGGDHNHL